MQIESKNMQTLEKIYTPNYQPFRWSYSKYLKLSEQGFFEDKRTELIDGEIIFMSAMNAPHYWAVTQATKVLQKSFGDEFTIAVQLPLKISEENAPQPDLAVIRGNRMNFMGNLPNTAALVLEVSDSSIVYDQTEKASLYAKADIQDYWIINLQSRRLEIRRNPITDENAVFGFLYAETHILREDDIISPLAAPEAKLKVADLLP